MIVHEATLTCGYGAELAALVQRDCFYHLEAPVIRVTGWDTPYPHAQEWAYFPGPDRVGRLDIDYGSLRGDKMALFTIKLPDVGEGVAEAELVEWHVKLGDVVREDDLLAAVMTDKATVEIPSSRAGKVVALNGEVGEKIAVGSELVRLEIEGGATEKAEEPEPEAPAPVETKPDVPAATQAPVLLQTPVPEKPATPKRESASRPLRVPARFAAKGKTARHTVRQIAGAGCWHRPAPRTRHRSGRAHHA